MKRLLSLLCAVVAALSIFVYQPVKLHAFALQAVIYSDLAANLVYNRSWIKASPAYGLPWDDSGHWTNYLDGTGTTGATGAFTCAWSVTSGTATITSPSSCTSAVTGVSFGQVIVQLIVTDSAMAMSTTTQTIGVTGCDANGNVIARDANFTEIFGPQVCLGRSPDGWMDQTHFRAMLARNTVYNTADAYDSYTPANPSWVNLQTGTVSYTWMGVGTSQGLPGVALHTTITSSSTSIVLESTNIANIDLTSFPTRILIEAATGLGPYEEIRICSAASNTPSAGLTTLSVCYNGRGVTGSTQANMVGAQGWTAGAIVCQDLVKGSGTSFLSTLSSVAGGLIGPVAYSTGTASVNAGSTTLAGSGTTWTSGMATWHDLGGTTYANAVVLTGMQSGNPFTFVSYISSVNSGTGITLSQAFPASATNATNVSYQIILPFYRYIVTGFHRLAPYNTGTFGNFAWAPTGCEDDTHCFFNPGLNFPSSAIDNSALNGMGKVSGQSYTFGDWNAMQAYFNSGQYGGINFYGENLAWISLYERSGLSLAKTMADEMSAPWLQFPAFVGGYRPPGSWLFLGGGFNGTVAHYLLYGSPGIDELRPWFAAGATINATMATYGCNGNNTRDWGYQETALFMGAIFDPDTTSTNAPRGIPWRTYWQNFVGPGVGTDYYYNQQCKGTTAGVVANSFAAAAQFNQTTPVTMTNGSAAVTGSGFTSANCAGIDQGTAGVTIGSNLITATSGTFSATAGQIMLGGYYYQFHQVDSTHGQISVLWSDSSQPTSAPFMTAGPIRTDDSAPNSISVYGQNSDDPALNYQYVCLYNNSGSLTLDRNWTGTTSGVGVTNYQYINFQAGRFQQPFFVGIKTYGTKLIAPLDATIGTDFTDLSAAVANWMHTYGFNYENQQIYYARVSTICEPQGSQVGIMQTFIWKNPGCGYGLNPPAVNFTVEGEQLNQEGFAALTLWYQNNANPTNKAVVDTIYNAVWTQTALNAPGVTDNANSVGNNAFASNLTDAQLALGKYPGQLFGMGFAATWPAQENPVATGGGSVSGGNTVSGGKTVRN